ncbi:MAG: AAA family ATPase [Gammaproteobacteria bacterium]|nr:AAA family ATPase [Gammaproteobacteria bacterium]MCP5195402.1 AAA family ATPase [Gammaproteobacteria bacterium]
MLKFAAFELDEANARLRRSDGFVIELPPRAFAVLCELGRRPGQLVTKDELLDAVWGHRYVSESVIKSTISQVRMALGDDARNPRYIETISRKGYRLVAKYDSGAPRFPREGLPAHFDWSSLPEHQIISAWVARSDLQSRLNDAWTAACAGQRRLCWIVGEAGIGKTTLIDSFTSGICGEDRIARGQCVEQHGAGEPYLPIFEALATQCEKDHRFKNLIRQVAPTWLLQLPWLVSDAEHAEIRQALIGASQDRMLRELGELLDRYTQTEPFILITEDLHWSDQATLYAMNHVARRRSSARLLWLASFRLVEVISNEHPLRTLRHELRLHQLCEELIVEPFTEQQIAEYVQRRVPGIQLPDTAVRTLHTSTDGLPLYLSNIIDDVLTKGLFDTLSSSARMDEWFSSLSVPESLAGVIEGQMSTLAEDQVRLLEVAAVCGIEFLPSTIAAVLGRNLHEVADTCERLSRQQRWLKVKGIDQLSNGGLDARYAFKHALYRQVFYERTSAITRAHDHRRIAAILEKAGSHTPPSEIALHYEAGHEPQSALHYYLAATENALRHLAPTDAIRLSERAQRLIERCNPNEHLDRQELLLYALRGAASAQALGVSSLETKRSFLQAEKRLQKHLDHPMRSLILHGLGLVLFVRGEYAEAKQVAERGLTLARQGHDRLLLVAACDLLGQMHTIQGQLELGLGYLQDGLSAAREIGDEVLLAVYVVDPIVTMTAALSLPLLHLGRALEGKHQLDAARARASALKQPMAIMVALWFSALFEVRRNNISRISELADQLRSLVDESNLAQGEGPTRWYRGLADAHLTDPLAGFALIRSGYDHNLSLGMYAGATEVLGYAAEALLLVGDGQGAQAQLAESFRLVDQLPERAYLPKLLLLQAEVLEASGDKTGSDAARQQALAEARQQKALWMEFYVLVEICRRHGAEPIHRESLVHIFERLDTGLDSPLVELAQQLIVNSR